MAWSDPRTWVAGEKPSAAILNQHIRDNFRAIGDAWTAFTPTWTAATVNPSIGNGSLVGFCAQAGKLVLFRVRVTFGSTTNAGTGAYSWALPVDTVALTPVGNCLCFDTSATAVRGRMAYATGASSFGVIDEGGTRVGSGTPFTWATGDVIYISGVYEAA